MIVCIAEKPSVAKDIARILGATTQCDGYMEGNGYQVTWTFGHLCELKYPEDYTSIWRGWRLETLPMIPSRFGIRLKKDKGVEKQFSVIERLMKAADTIINCGDAGQEGELIQRWVMKKAGAACPVKRLWISSLTEEAIREGFNSLKPQDDYQSLYEAGLSRAIGDWLLGMNASRLYTIKYGTPGSTPLSVGRVQTPTLALIVNRQKEIENFNPEAYWVLTTNYRDTIFTATKGKFSTEEEGLDFLSKVKDSEFCVTDVSAKKGTEAPPRLFDLTSLQVECNKKFGFSAERTLQIIQSLYEKKITTYPRVDTTFLSDDIYPKCGDILNGLKDYYSLFTPLKGKKLRKSKKVFDTSKVTDHHAIIPTGVHSNSLNADEHSVYDLVVRRFIAVFYDDCKFSTTTVLGEAGSVTFKVTGKQILEQGWRAVFAQNNQEEKEDEGKDTDPERTLPLFVKGETGSHLPDLAQKWTQAPKPYTEATLLRAMETAGKLVESEELRDALKENGIGRPSTRAAIIETLFRRRYIRKERKSLFATATGVELIDIIQQELLKSAELTGLWEKKLREIERKEYDAHLFLEELKTMLTQIVFEVVNDNSHRYVTASTAEDKEKKTSRKTSKTKQPKKKEATVKEGDTCPLCGKGVVVRGRTSLGCSCWKEGCKFRAPIEQ